MREKKKSKLTKIIILNIVIFICLFIIAEISTRLYLLISRGSATVSIQERTLNLKYQPFVMFGYDWHKKFQGIEKKKENELRVLILGGSTAWAFPVEVLEEELKKFTDKKVKVINGAYGAYNIRQEIVLYTLYGNNIYADYVISLNGANDLLQSIRGEIDKGSFLLNRKYKMILEKPYLGPLIWLAQYSQFYNGLHRLSARFKKFEISEYQSDIKLFIENHDKLNRIIRSYGAKHIAILQPYMGFKENKSKNEQLFQVYDFRDKIVKQLFLETDKKLSNFYNNKNNTNYFNSQKLYNIDEQVFSDDFHFVNNLGYKLLSREIALNIFK